MTAKGPGAAGKQNVAFRLRRPRAAVRDHLPDQVGARPNSVVRNAGLLNSVSTGPAAAERAIVAVRMVV